MASSEQELYVNVSYLNHASAVVDGLRDIYNRKYSTNLANSDDNGTPSEIIAAHRLMFEIFCPKLNTLVITDDKTDKSSASCLAFIIELIYCGKVDVPEGLLSEFQQLIKSYGIRGLFGYSMNNGSFKGNPVSDSTKEDDAMDHTICEVPDRTDDSEGQVVTTEKQPKPNDLTERPLVEVGCQTLASERNFGCQTLMDRPLQESIQDVLNLVITTYTNIMLTVQWGTGEVKNAVNNAIEILNEIQPLNCVHDSYKVPPLVKDVQMVNKACQTTACGRLDSSESSLLRTPLKELRIKIERCPKIEEILAAKSADDLDDASSTVSSSEQESSPVTNQEARLRNRRADFVKSEPETEEDVNNRKLQIDSFILQDEFPLQGKECDISIVSKNSRGRLECSLCSHRAGCMLLMKRHIVVHYPVGVPYACAVCEETFSRRTQLQEHLTQHSKPHEQFACTKCDYYTSLRHELSQHLAQVHALTMGGIRIRPNYHCPYCKYVGQNTFTLKQHLFHSHKKSKPPANCKPYTCKVCGFATLSRTKLEFHVKTRHMKTENSDSSDCPSKYDRLRNSGEYMKCDECGQRFASNVIFEEHQKNKKRRCRRFKCLRCPRLIHGVAMMIRHQTQKEHGEGVLCRGCGIQIKTHEELKTHSHEMTDN